MFLWLGLFLLGFLIRRIQKPSESKKSTSSKMFITNTPRFRIWWFSCVVFALKQDTSSRNHGGRCEQLPFLVFFFHSLNTKRGLSGHPNIKKVLLIKEFLGVPTNSSSKCFRFPSNRTVSTTSRTPFTKAPLVWTRFYRLKWSTSKAYRHQVHIT